MKKNGGYGILIKQNETKTADEGEKMYIQESGEMYLETILILTNRQKNVRAIDVGEYMGFSKPSVSRAMGILKSGGLVETDKDGF